MAPHLSIVVPAWNEQDRIGASLDRIRGWLERQPEPHEVLVVDDGSQDETAQRVTQAAAAWPELRLLQLPRNQGKGAATRHGVLAAQGRWILCSDADLSTPIDYAAQLLRAGERAPVVIGSRSIEGSDITRSQPPHRVIMGRVFNWAARSVTPGGHADTQCGFKLYRADAARDIFSRLTISGFAFDVEVLFLAHRLGWEVLEVPVAWHNDERTTVSSLSDPPRMLVDIMRIRRRHRGLAARRDAPPVTRS